MTTNPTTTISLLDRLERGEKLISDGGSGTYLQAHGLEPGGSPELMNIEQPEVVRQMAADFYAAGSDMVLTNSFGGNRFGNSSLGFGGASGFGGGFSSSSFGMGGRSRRSMYGTGGRTHFNPVFKQGLNLSTGYIINTGQKPIEVPNPNEVPSRLQAFNLNTSFGQRFDLAWLINPIPFIFVNLFYYKKLIRPQNFSNSDQLYSMNKLNYFFLYYPL